MRLMLTLLSFCAMRYISMDRPLQSKGFRPQLYGYIRALIAYIKRGEADN